MNDNGKHPEESESLSKVMNTISTKRVVTSGVILTTMDILGSIFFTFYNMALARLPPHEGGVLTLVSSFQSMLRVFALLGFTGAGAKFISEYLERDKSEARKYGISASKYNFTIIGLPIIAFAVLLFWYMSMEGDPLTTQAFLILIFLTVADRLRSCADTYLLAYQRYDLYAVAWGVPYGLMYLAALVLIYVIGPIGPLIAWTIGTLVQFFWSLYYVRKVSDFPVRDLFSWRKEYNLFKKMVSFNFLYSLANLCFSLLTTTLLITMGKVLGILTNQEVQSLGVISTFSNILINVFGIVSGIQPAVSQAFALKNKKLVNNYFLASVKFPLMMSVAVITFFILYAQEMITIFFSQRYIVIGLAIMVFLMPSYAFGSFASRYDNILAGVGRPETAIMPWFIGMGVALLGFLLTWLFVPDGQFLYSYPVSIYIDGVPTVVDYGITSSFLACLASMAVGLTIPGVWIVWISIKVLNVRIPSEYIVRPIVSAFITGITFYLIKIFVPFKEFLDVALSEDIGGIVFTVIMVISGVFVFLTLGTIIGAFTREDGRFWRSVVGTIPVARSFLSPVFKWGRYLVEHVPARFKTEDYPWITSTRREEMLKDAEFTIDDDFATRYPDGRLPMKLSTGPEILQVDVALNLNFSGIKAPFYGVVITPKIDMHVLNDSIKTVPVIDANMVVPLHIVIPASALIDSKKYRRLQKVQGEPSDLFHVLANAIPAHHELYIDVEMYVGPPASRKVRNSWFDFGFKWYDEKILFVTLYNQDMPHS